MLQYKNHRFYYEGVSFAIPDGYYLDTNYGDGAEDALDFWTKDMSLRLRVAIERGTKGPLAELNSVIRDLEDCVVMEGPAPSFLSGLAGYVASYDTGRRQYYEMRYSINEYKKQQNEIILLFIGDPKLPNMEVLMELVRAIAPTKE